MKTIRRALKLSYFLGLLLAGVAGALLFNCFLVQKFYYSIVLFILIIATLVLALLLYHHAKKSILTPLEKLTKELSIKTTSGLEAINSTSYPQEFQAVLEELNSLFSRTHADFERNKRFSADAAHELRTPMTALKTQAQLALQMTEPAERKKAIENVIISINRSIHVIQQLLTLSRLDHEDKLHDISDIHLESIAAELIAFMYPQALEKDIEIELSNESKMPIIKGNEAALGVLLRNLIDNAIRYTPNKGKIEVKIKEHSQTILLQIIDNGPGIPEEYRDKVFDRFFRVLGTKQTGSGLGLAIVKQIIHLHKGKIHLQTSESGHGLTVTVFFRKPK